MTSEELQNALLAALAPQPAAGGGEPVTTPSSGIDDMLGGDALKGKKTLLAVLAYVVLSILQSQDIVGLAVPTAQQQAAAATTAQTGAAAPASPQTPATAQPAAGAAKPAGEAAPAAAPAAASSAATPAATPTAAGLANYQTPTGTVLTVLIAAFGGLGLLAKVDRGIKSLAMLAGAK
jgi:hypothetical protein